MIALRHIAALVASCLFTASSGAHAQSAMSPSNETLQGSSLRSMTLADAIEYAKSHHPAVLAGRARVASLREAANIPRAQWKPFVGLNAQVAGATANNTTTNYVSPAYIDLPRIGATRAVSSGSFQPYASTLVAAGVSQELFDFGRIAAETSAADQLAEVQVQASRGALLDITYGVEEAYFAVEAAKAILHAADDAYARTKVHRDFAASGVQSGMRPPIELTRAESDLARYDAGRIHARGGVDLAQTFLAASVGVTDAALDTRGTPTDPADMPQLNDAIAKAGARDPLILQAIEQLRADELHTRAIAAQNLPDISLSASVSGRAGGAPPSSGQAAFGAGLLPDVANWNVGVVLSWRLFDPAVNARIVHARAEELVRHEELDETQLRQIAAIRSAFIAVQVARAELPALQQSLAAARDNWLQADARFRAGLGSAVELADAQALLADAEVHVALGGFAIARARAAFGRTIAEGL